MTPAAPDAVELQARMGQVVAALEYLFDSTQEKGHWENHEIRGFVSAILDLARDGGGEDRLSARPQGQWADKQDERRWLIYYADVDRSFELFVGEGSERVARERHRRLLDNWTCWLFAEEAAAPVGTEAAK